MSFHKGRQIALAVTFVTSAFLRTDRTTFRRMIALDSSQNRELFSRSPLFVPAAAIDAAP